MWTCVLVVQRRINATRSRYCSSFRCSLTCSEIPCENVLGRGFGSCSDTHGHVVSGRTNTGELTMATPFLDLAKMELFSATIFHLASVYSALVSHAKRQFSRSGMYVRVCRCATTTSTSGCRSCTCCTSCSASTRARTAGEHSFVAFCWNSLHIVQDSSCFPSPFWRRVHGDDAVERKSMISKWSAGHQGKSHSSTWGRPVPLLAPECTSGVSPSVTILFKRPSQ